MYVLSLDICFSFFNGCWQGISLKQEEIIGYKQIHRNDVRNMIDYVYASLINLQIIPTPTQAFYLHRFERLLIAN